MRIKRSQAVAAMVSLGVETAEAYDCLKLETKFNHDGGIERYLEVPTQRPKEPELATLVEEMVAAYKSGNQIVVEDDQVSEETPSKPDFVEPEPEREKEAEVEKEEEETEPVAAVLGTNGVHHKPRRGRPPGSKNQKAAVATKMKVKKAPKSKKKAANSGKDIYEGHGSFSEWKKALAKKPKPLPEEGITRVIYDELKRAGKNPDKPKPITKEGLLGVLKENFPDRDPGKMMGNINNTVPSRLLWMHGINTHRARSGKGEPYGYYIVGDGGKPQDKTKKPMAVVEPSSKVTKKGKKKCPTCGSTLKA